MGAGCGLSGIARDFTNGWGAMPGAAGNSGGEEDDKKEDGVECR